MTLDNGLIPASAWEPAQRALGFDRAHWLDFFAAALHQDPQATNPEDHSQHTPEVHTALAQAAVAHLEQHAKTNPDLASKNLHWWAQMVTILFEQHTGRRAANQRCDGSFAGSASKTIAGDFREVAQAWAQWAPNNFPLPVDGAPRTSSTEKWEYWRVSTTDAASVSVNITTRAPGKTVVSIDASKLNSAEQSAEYKALFKQVLGEFAAAL